MQGQLRSWAGLTDIAPCDGSVLNEQNGIIHGELSMRAGAFNIERRFISADNRGLASIKYASRLSSPEFVCSFETSSDLRHIPIPTTTAASHICYGAQFFIYSDWRDNKRRAPL